jgi:hypothetical protein
MIIAQKSSNAYRKRIRVDDVVANSSLVVGNTNVDTKFNSYDSQLNNLNNELNQLQQQLDSLSNVGNSGNSIFINVLDNGLINNGTTECSIILQSLLNSLTNGGTLFFPNGVYLFSNPIIVTNSNIKLMGETNTVFIAPNIAMSQSLIKVSTNNLNVPILFSSSTISKNSNTIALTTNAESVLIPSQYVYIQSNDGYDVGMNGKRGEINRVLSISGQILTLEMNTSFEYTNSISIRPVNLLKNITIENINIIMNGIAKNEIGISLEYCEHPLVRNVCVDKADNSGLTLNFCVNSIVKDCQLFNATNNYESAGYGYGLAIYASYNTLIQTCIFKNCKHSITAGSATLPVMNCIVKQCISEDSWKGSYEIHEPCYNFLFDGNMALRCATGFSIRGSDVSIQNNVIIDSAQQAIEIRNWDTITTGSRQRNILISANRIECVNGDGIDIGTSDASIRKLENICVVDNYIEVTNGNCLVSRFANNLLISDNQMVNSARGVYLGNESNNVIIRGGTILNTSEDSIYIEGTATNLTIDSISVLNSSKCGVNMNSASDVSIFNVSIKNAASNSMKCLNCNKLRIKNCIYVAANLNTSDTPLRLEGCSFVRIEYNDIECSFTMVSTSGGISCIKGAGTSSNILIRNNFIKTPKKYPIIIDGASIIYVKGNRIEDNVYGIQIKNCTKVMNNNEDTISLNEIINIAPIITALSPFYASSNSAAIVALTDGASTGYETSIGSYTSYHWYTSLGGDSLYGAGKGSVKSTFSDKIYVEYVRIYQLTLPYTSGVTDSSREVMQSGNITLTCKKTLSSSAIGTDTFNVATGYTFPTWSGLNITEESADMLRFHTTMPEAGNVNPDINAYVEIPVKQFIYGLRIDIHNRLQNITPEYANENRVGLNEIEIYGYSNFERPATRSYFKELISPTIDTLSERVSNLENAGSSSPSNFWINALTAAGSPYPPYFKSSSYPLQLKQSYVNYQSPSLLMINDAAQSDYQMICMHNGATGYIQNIFDPYFYEISLGAQRSGSYSNFVIKQFQYDKFKITNNSTEFFTHTYPNIDNAFNFGTSSNRWNGVYSLSLFSQYIRSFNNAIILSISDTLLTTVVPIIPLTSGTLSIGTSSNRFGNIYLVNNPDVSSDFRIKQNIENIPFGLDFICDLVPVSYEFKDEYYPEEKKKKRLGFIAQQVEEITDDASNYAFITPPSEENFASLDYVSIVPILVKAVQELSLEIDALHQKILILESKLNSFKN